MIETFNGHVKWSTKTKTPFLLARSNKLKKRKKKEHLEATLHLFVMISVVVLTKAISTTLCS